MTGFASVTEGDVAVTLKSVNGKGLDLHFHLPAAFDAAEPRLRQLIREQVSRGTVQVRVGWNTQQQTGLNRELLQRWLQNFRDAAAELGLENQQPDLNGALRLPGMFEPAESTDEAPNLEPIFRAALAELNEFREREGARLGEELLARSRGLATIAAEIEQLREGASAAFHLRLNARITELLGTVADPQRLALEVALLVERSDVSEELVRLRTHTAELSQLLQASSEIGKKIDFLLQEMNRETNTILSKTGGLGEIGLRITNLALAAKAEIDKIREQSLNLE